MATLYGSTTLLLLTCGLVAGILLLLYVKLLPKTAISKLHGPPSPSWLLGNMEQYDGSEAGVCDFAWAKEFGSTWRIDGGLGEEFIVTSDPKALQFVFQTSSYNFKREDVSQAKNALLFGKGILSTEGEVHKRHRKVMLPAFALGEIRAMTPIFQSKAVKMVQAWVNTTNDLGDDKTSQTIDVHSWISRATLDAIGEAAFNYDFGGLAGSKNPIAENFKNIFISLFRVSLRKRIALQNILQQLPFWVTRLAMRMPTHENKRRAQCNKLTSEVAKDLIKAKQSVQGTDFAQKDVMSLLVKSNSSETEKARLSEEEMIGQMNSLMLAGHETTSNMLAWTLYELAKLPETQRKLRQEIKHWYELARGNGEECISVSDYEKMEYTTAVMKESLRLNPIAPRLQRVAAKDLVIPFSDPIRTTDGQTTQSLAVKKGQSVLASVAHYNRRQELWGQDADCFRPERWLENLEAKVKFGVYGNLGTFGAGIHACIGWRFAVYEAQSFLIEMLDKFEFAPSEETKLVIRANAGVMSPALKTNDKQNCMPLRVSPIE